MTRHLFRGMLATASCLVINTGLLAEEPVTRVVPEPPGPARPQVKTEPSSESQPATPGKKMKAEAGPATAAVVTPDARKVLDDVRDAYAALQSLELSGTVSSDFQVGGEKQNNTQTFTSTYQSPNKFRHEMKDDMLVGSTGEKVFAYQSGQNLYVFKDAPKERVALKDLPEPINEIVEVQNPALALALAKDAGDQLVGDGTAVKKLDDVRIDGKSLLVVAVSAPLGEFTFMVDQETRLLRKVTVDQRAYLEKLGQPDVKRALLTFDYTKTTVDSVANDAPFAWAPPASARDLATLAAARGGDDENPAAKLEGKAAPDFKLVDLKGKDVSLSALKGSVVVVDFWATWCGPCVQSLPHLNALYNEMKPAGLQVIAVSVDEDKGKVPTFVTDKKLGFTVVIDTDEAKVAEKYAVQGIPQTVVIGKDGKIRKVFVGFGPGSEEKLRAEVDAAMK